MELITRLKKDHEIIDRVGGSLLAWWQEVQKGAGDAGDLAGFVQFLACYGCGFHHRAEEILFNTLVDHAEVPGDRGPIAVLRSEHHRLAQGVEDLGLLRGKLDQDESETDATIRRVVHLIWEHIDKENSVLLPESKKRLERNGVPHLAPPEVLEDEIASREIVEALIERYPPIDDPEVIRGDGCMACSVFSVDCRGIEAEWWTSWELSHYRSLDEG